MAMKQLRSELEPSGPAIRARAVAVSGAALSGPHVDRLLAEPAVEPEAAATPANPPPMHGIWLGAAAGILIWLALAAAAFLWLS